MADNEALLAQFMAITGVDTERATFFLEAAGWNLDVAMGNFYDNDGDEAQDQEAGEVVGAAAGAEPAVEEVQSGPAQNRAQRQSGIRTIQGLMDAHSDESDEDGQAFFAGGSETSGQQILGPRRGKRGEDIVKEMFRAAKGQGAEEVEPTSEPGRPQPSTFGGSGYRLGQTGSDSEKVPAAPDRRPPQPRTVKLRLWKAGFSVDDGELREYSDPDNQEFLNSVRGGQVPLELIREAQGGEVHLDMEDHRHEDYEKPKAKPKPFSGRGHVLGSPGEPAAAAAAAEGWSLSAILWRLLGLMGFLWRFFSPAPAVAAARAALGLDEAQPTTSVQVRLADGSRLIIKLNLSHTIGDLRRYIVTARPQYGGTPFSLLTTFPSKELTDDSLSVQDGQLQNAAILQRAL
ncbi:NSFL1 cofactor p47-like [Pollicipes pollicipes]|uniref:NSFL1 cofactor p47-like n=1 Tax=Pollicipes pollicipes TaxID=41117 RepID=UPI0018849BE0|nr:NSFL1 cofactor p47-like [Pollicipes pollicipes]XP_037067903.1 NSFL1 cofactor p47-like [Pollicipes pollicipes]